MGKNRNRGGGNKRPRGSSGTGLKQRIKANLSQNSQVRKKGDGNQHRRTQEEAEKLRSLHAEYKANQKKTSLEDIQRDALERQQQYDLKESIVERMGTASSQTGLLSSETSRKAYYKEFKKVIDIADVVIEVLDARDPLGCRCKDVEEAILTAGANKKIILLLNKIDLVPKQNVESWLKYLRNEYPTVAFKSSTQTQRDRLTHINVPIKDLDEATLSSTSKCVGAENLLKLLSNYSRHKDTKTSIIVGVVGYPNVGKSSLINSLKRAKACGVGSTPGFTKTVKEVTITKNIKILDSPGIVMTTGSNEAAVVLRNCVKVEALDDPVTPVDAILDRCNRNKIMQEYGVMGCSGEVNEFLSLLAKRHGKLLKGGEPNVNEAARMVLNDWNNGRITYYTHPPERRNVHLGAKVVTEMQEEFDWSSLDEINKDTLKEVDDDRKEGEENMESSEVEKKAIEVIHMSDDDAAGGEDGMELEANKISALGEICVEMRRDRKNKKKKRKSEEVTAGVAGTSSVGGSKKRRRIDNGDPFAGLITKGSNISVNQQMKSMLKASKKKKKRSEKLGDQLGASLESAFKSFGGPSTYRRDDSDVDMTDD